MSDQFAVRLVKIKAWRLLLFELKIIPKKKPVPAGYRLFECSYTINNQNLILRVAKSSRPGPG